MSIMLERVTSLRVDVVSSLIFCVLSSLSCVLSHFLGCPLPAGVGWVRHMGCCLPRLTHHDTSYNVWEDFQTQTNVLPYITGRTESIFHHRCKASLVAMVMMVRMPRRIFDLIRLLLRLPHRGHWLSRLGQPIVVAGITSTSSLPGA